MKCPNCNSENPENSRYCNKCATTFLFKDETLVAPPDVIFLPEKKIKKGETLAGKYKIIDKLGGGGMGVVYKAEDTRLKRLVALKFLPSMLTSLEDAKTRFIQEAQAASMLDHQNICTIHEIDETDDGQMYIAMAFYEGKTLKKKIEKGPLPIDQALDIIIQVTQGLAKAHSQRIVHRDIKPANLIVTNDGVVKIVDFGLAKFAGQKGLTEPGTAVGTTFYMSPEQTSGEEVDEKTDLWSTGIVFYELLTGKMPFIGENEQAVMYKILNRTPVAPTELRMGIPEEAERIILKCLRKKPEDRYSSADRLLSALIKLKKSQERKEADEKAKKEEIPEAKKETERRQATVMFIEITGYSEMLGQLDTEEAAILINRCFAIFDAIITKYGGRINTITGGNIMALFGIPQAIEDAPKKSVNAGIELRKRLYQFDQDEALEVLLDVRIGIDTGMVIASALGAGEIKEFSIMGEAANMASLLKDLSEKGKIWVGPQTYKYTQNEFEYEELKPISLKGKDKPVSSFELLSEKEKVYRARLGAERMIYSELVGRDEELDKLKLQVLKVINGEGSIVNVIGEAGIGKSRLIAELSQKDEMKKLNFLKGRALSIGKNLSFHPIIEILKNWARIKEEDSPITTAQKFEKAIKSIYPEGVSEVFPFTATMMGIKLMGRYAERVKGIEGEALEKLILKNLRELIIKAAEPRPLVIAIEDLHWADLTSIEFLESLYRLAGSQKILFINIFRPNYEQTGDRIWRKIKERYWDYYTEIYLEPLDENQCQILVENLLNVKGLPVHIRELIAARAEGNPFFIEEVVRSLIDDEIIEVKDGRFRVTEKIDAVVLPKTINEILMARIDKLDEGTKSLLKIASVIGRNFYYKILTEVAQNIEEVDDKLEFLKEVQLIQERRRKEELEYFFKHALVQDVTYDSILLKKRKQLHVRVAEAIESVFAERLHEFYGMLALHYSSGENFEKAEEYLVKAGEEALKAAASSEAINYYQDALKLYLRKHGDYGDPDSIAHLEWNIAKAFLNKGHMGEAVIHFDKVLEIWGERRPKKKIATLLYLFWNLLKVLRSLYLPTRKVKQSPSKHMNDIFEVTYQRGMALVSVDTFRMVKDSIRFLGFVRKYDLNKVANGVPMYASSSALFFISGISFRIARKLLDYARSYIRPNDLKTLLTYNFWELAMDTLWGNWDRAQKYEENIIDRNIQDGDLFTAPGLVFWNGILATEKGNFKDTEIYIEKLNEISEVYENDYARSRRFALRTKYFLKSRKLRDVLKETEKEIPWLNRIGQKFWALFLLGDEAKTHLLLGDMQAAKRTLEQGEEIASLEKRLAPFYISNFRRSQFFFEVYKLEETLNSDNSSELSPCRKKIYQRGKEAVKNAKKCAINRTEILKLMGIHYWLIGKPKKAFTWWERSIKIGEKLGARPELGRTYMEVGKRLQENEKGFKELNGLTADDYFDKARILFEEMDLKWDLEELEKM